MRILNSEIDQSVNFIEDQLTGFLESRYVRRSPDYFIAYLSSQTGCNRGCRFCHLTASKQTMFEDSTHNDFIGQALNVLRHYRRALDKGEPVAKIVHYNFMARGEPLANQVMLSSGEELLWKLGGLASDAKLYPKFNISTILPKTVNKPLHEIFGSITPTIYYSLYSTNDAFRKDWMPGAMPLTEALPILTEYQRVTKKIIKIHHALIRGRNDSVYETDRMCDLLLERGLRIEFNLVRYNPFSPEQGSETDDEQRLKVLERMRYRLGSHAVKEIPRVGFDVNASCGMFVDKE